MKGEQQIAVLILECWIRGRGITHGYIGLLFMNCLNWVWASVIYFQNNLTVAKFISTHRSPLQNEKHIIPRSPQPFCWWSGWRLAWRTFHLRPQQECILFSFPPESSPKYTEQNSPCSVFVGTPWRLFLDPKCRVFGRQTEKFVAPWLPPPCSFAEATIKLAGGDY